MALNGKKEGKPCDCYDHFVVYEAFLVLLHLLGLESFRCVVVVLVVSLWDDIPLVICGCIKLWWRRWFIVTTWLGGSKRPEEKAFAAVTTGADLLRWWCWQQLSIQMLVMIQLRCSGDLLLVALSAVTNYRLGSQSRNCRLHGCIMKSRYMMIDMDLDSSWEGIIGGNYGAQEKLPTAGHTTDFRSNTYEWCFKWPS